MALFPKSHKPLALQLRLRTFFRAVGELGEALVRFHPRTSTPSELSSSQTSNHHPAPLEPNKLIGTGFPSRHDATMRTSHGTTDQIRHNE